MPASPELSSIAATLEDLTRRIGSLAEQSGAMNDEESASELFAVERALTSATRRLNRLNR
jgi:flagellar biosynthesis/type III secretory pathway chaperone